MSTFSEAMNESLNEIKKRPAGCSRPHGHNVICGPTCGTDMDWRHNSMAEPRQFFVVAESYAAPFVSDSSKQYVHALTPSEALGTFIQAYSHPFGLYSANVYESADDYHQKKEPVAKFRSRDAKIQWESKQGV